MSISGAARSSVVRTIETDEVLWKWNGIDTSQFTLDLDEPGSGAVLSVDNVADSVNFPWAPSPILKVTSAGDNGWRVWNINDFVIPPSGRFIVDMVLGPRNPGGANFGAGNLPTFVFGYQDSNHVIQMGRDSVGPDHPILFFSDNQDLFANAYATPTFNTVDLGQNTDAGGRFRFEVALRHPGATSDPAMKLFFPTGAQYDIEEEHAFDPSWQGNGNLKIGIGNFETGAAGSSYFANITIRRHPSDLEAIDVSSSIHKQVTQALSDEQTGTVAKNVGSVYLPAGTLKQTSAILMGTTTAAPDEATVELRSESDGSLIATWTRQGPLQNTILSANATIPLPGWYTLELSADSGGVIAQIKGIDLKVV